MKRNVKSKKAAEVETESWFTNLLGWVLGNKIVLGACAGLILTGFIAYKNAQSEKLRYKTLELAYKNQTKELDSTKKELKKVRIAKNVVKIKTRTVNPDGTINETETTKDNTVINNTTDTTSKNHEETRVVMPSLAQQLGLGFRYQTTGYGSASELERLMLVGEYKIFEPLWLGVNYQFSDKTWIGGTFRW